ncbi:hypothetical protein ACFL6S_18470 [Candidatus Poribacteria bacterium]
MKKSKKMYTGIAGVIAAVLVVGALTVGAGLFGNDQMMSARLYRNGMYLGTLASVIGEYENVTHIDFPVRIRNTGSIPLSCQITSASPSALSYSSSPKGVNTGQTVEWMSNQVPSAPYDDTVQTFSVNTRCDYTYGGQANSMPKSASVTLKIDLDPDAGYIVNMSSSVGGSNGGIDPDPGEDPGDPGCRVSGTLAFDTDVSGNPAGECTGVATLEECCLITCCSSSCAYNSGHMQTECS